VFLTLPEVGHAFRFELLVVVQKLVDTGLLVVDTVE